MTNPSSQKQFSIAMTSRNIVNGLNPGVSVVHIDDHTK